MPPPASAFPSVLEDISRLLCADIHGDAVIEAARGLLSDEQTSKRRKILSDLLQNLEDRSELETRDEDEDWFKGGTHDGCTPALTALEYNTFHGIYNPDVMICEEIF